MTNDLLQQFLKALSRCTRKLVTPDTLRGDGFAFVFTQFDYTGDLPFEVFPKFWLQRPTETQLDIIQDALLHHAGNPLGIFGRYQHEWKTTETETRTFPLPPDQWRYWVINFEEFSWETLHAFKDAAMLMSPGLEICWFWVPWGEDGALAGPSGHAGHAVSFFSAHHGPTYKIPTLGPADLVECQHIYRELQAARQAYPYVERAVKNYRTLLHLPPRGTVHMAGIFLLLRVPLDPQA